MDKLVGADDSIDHLYNDRVGRHSFRRHLLGPHGHGGLLAIVVTNYTDSVFMTFQPRSGPAREKSDERWRWGAGGKAGEE